MAGIHLDYIRIVGLSHYNFDTSKVSDGDILNLIPDPTNNYDSNAVEVHHDILGKIGFLKAQYNSPYFNLLQAGHMLDCRVVDSEVKQYSIKASIALVTD